MRDSLKYNHEGYSDPTAHAGMQSSDEAARKMNEMIKAVKYIIRVNGFELMNRIEVRDTNTGIVYR